MDKIKNEIDKIESLSGDLRKELNEFGDNMEEIVDVLENLDDDIDKLLEKIGDSEEMIFSFIKKGLKKVVNYILKNIEDADFIIKFLKGVFKIIYDIVSTVWNYIYKKYPEVRTILFIAGFFASLPLLALVMMKLSILEMFIPKQILIIVLLVVILLLYFFIWDILKWFFNFIWKTIARIDWEDVIKDSANEIKDIFLDIIKKIIKLFD